MQQPFINSTILKESAINTPTLSLFFPTPSQTLSALHFHPNSTIDNLGCTFAFCIDKAVFASNSL